MASAFSHAFLALTLGKASQHPVFTWPVLFLGMGCSIVPDLDVIGFSFGIQYGDVWGHLDADGLFARFVPNTPSTKLCSQP